MYCQELSCSNPSPCSNHPDKQCEFIILLASEFPKELSETVQEYAFVATVSQEDFEKSKISYEGSEFIPQIYSETHEGGDEARETSTASTTATTKEQRGRVIVGICTGEIQNKCIYLAKLVLSPYFRKGGLGKNLVAHAVDLGQKKSCTVIHLWTLDFQAPSYYGKLGFNMDISRSVSGAWVKERSHYCFSASLPPSGHTLSGLSLPTPALTINGVDIAVEELSHEPAAVRQFGVESFQANTTTVLKQAHPDIPRRTVYEARNSQGQLVGAVQSFIVWDGVFLKNLFVKEQNRGRGIGKLLLNAALARGQSLGAGMALAFTTDDNAREFLVHNGWHLDINKPPFANLSLPL